MMKNIGKPCAGKPHARFDEGRVIRHPPTLPFRSWIGVRNGSGVAYQIRQALEGMKKDPVFACQMDKLERELSKEEAS
jgi:hypothetical protein